MAYERVNWENLPSKNTPVNADNLNKMDKGIKDLETELSKKANSADVYTKTEIDEIKTEGLSFTNPEKFNGGDLTSVKVGRLVFIVGFFVPNTQVGGNLINLKYKPIYADKFWGVLHATESATTNYHCYVNGYGNTPYLASYGNLEANKRYWIDIKYITNE